MSYEEKKVIADGNNYWNKFKYLNSSIILVFERNGPLQVPIQPVCTV